MVMWWQIAGNHCHRTARTMPAVCFLVIFFLRLNVKFPMIFIEKNIPKIKMSFFLSIH